VPGRLELDSSLKGRSPASGVWSRKSETVLRHTPPRGLCVPFVLEAAA
jgi:hypothetical protein